MKNMSATLVALAAFVSPILIQAQEPKEETTATEKLNPADCFKSGQEAQDEGEKFESKQDFQKAIYAYNEAISCYRTAQMTDPKWNEERVNTRIDLCVGRIKTLERRLREDLNEAKAKSAILSNPSTVTPKLTEKPNASRPTLGASKYKNTRTEPTTPRATPGSLSSIVEEVARMETEIQNLRAENDQLSTDLAAARVELQNAQANEAQSAELARITQQVEALTRQANEAKANLDYVQGRNDATTRSLVQTETKLKASQGTVAELQAKLNNLRADLRQSTQKIESLQTDLKNNQTAAETALKSLQENHAKQIAEREKTIKTQLEEKSTQITQLTQSKDQQIATLTTQGTQLTQKLKEAQEALQVNTVLLKTEQDKNKVLIGQIQELTIQVNQSKNVLSQLSNAQKQMEEQAKSIEKLTQENQTYTKAIEQINTEKTQIQAELTRATQANSATATDHNNTLNALNKQIEDLKQDLASQNSDQSKTIVDLNNQRAELAKELSTLQKEITTLQKQNETLKDKAEKALEFEEKLNATTQLNTELKSNLVKAENDLKSISDIRTKAEKLPKVEEELELNVRAQEALKHKLSNACDEIENLKRDIQKLKESPELQNNPEVIRLNAEKKELIKKAEQDRASLQSKIQAAEEQIAKLKNAPKSQGEETLKLKNETIDALMTERANLAKKITELQDELAKARGIK